MKFIVGRCAYKKPFEFMNIAQIWQCWIAKKYSKKLLLERIKLGTLLSELTGPYSDQGKAKIFFDFCHLFFHLFHFPMV